MLRAAWLVFYSPIALWDVDGLMARVYLVLQTDPQYVILSFMLCSVLRIVFWPPPSAKDIHADSREDKKAAIKEEISLQHV